MNTGFVQLCALWPWACRSTMYVMVGEIVAGAGMKCGDPRAICGRVICGVSRPIRRRLSPCSGRFVPRLDAATRDGVLRAALAHLLDQPTTTHHDLLTQRRRGAAGERVPARGARVCGSRVLRDPDAREGSALRGAARCQRLTGLGALPGVAAE